MSTALVTALITAAAAFFLNSYLAARFSARALRLVAIRTWQDDLYTFADVLNHAGAQHRWPGPIEDYWKPSADPHAYARIADHIRRPSVVDYLRSRRTPDFAWAHITAARRTMVYMLAAWKDDTLITDSEVEVLKGAFFLIERGRTSLGHVDQRFVTGQPRSWDEHCSVWKHIAEGPRR